MALSFAADIRMLFRDTPDLDSMREYGVDLSSYEVVKAMADRIYMVLEDGSMPCDGPLPMTKVMLFKQWMDEGMAP
jgi:hypothetical protein